MAFRARTVAVPAVPRLALAPLASLPLLLALAPPALAACGAALGVEVCASRDETGAAVEPLGTEVSWYPGSCTHRASLGGAALQCYGSVEVALLGHVWTSPLYCVLGADYGVGPPPAAGLAAVCPVGVLVGTDVQGICVTTYLPFLGRVVCYGGGY
jgi:hypothetical protein